MARFTESVQELGDVRDPELRLLELMSQAGGLVTVTATIGHNRTATLRGRIVAVATLQSSAESLPINVLIVFKIHGPGSTIAFPVATVVRVRWNWTR